MRRLFFLLLLLAVAASLQAAKQPQIKNQLAELLLSSLWCSFSYNKISGASSTKRVQFRSDGTWLEWSRYEGYSSGSGGTMASQHDATGGGNWKAEGNQLFMSSQQSPMLQPVEFTVNRNSNGYPIIHAGGVEYSQCR